MYQNEYIYTKKEHLLADRCSPINSCFISSKKLLTINRKEYSHKQTLKEEKKCMKLIFVYYSV